MGELIRSALAALGGIVVAAGGFAAVAVGVFKVLGEKWLSAKFEERLAGLRHVQQRELEELRFKINALFDRATKLHQREFEVLPETWSRLVDAHDHVASFVSPLQTYPDLNHMTQPQLDEFLSSSTLADWERTELKAQTDKTGYYVKRRFWHRLSDVTGVYGNFQVYLRKNGVFIHAEVRELFDQLEKLMWDAMVEHQMNEEHEIRPRQREHIQAFQKQGNELIKKLEAAVQGRLWDTKDRAKVEPSG